MGSVRIGAAVRRWWVAGVMSALVVMAMGSVSRDLVQAQPVNDYTSCGHFETQEAAQAVLDSGVLEDPSVLDGDGDGIACEDAFALDPDSPPPARDATSCGHFDTQAGAQEALDSGLVDDPSVLDGDGDGDGIACEDAFGALQPSVTRLPSTGIGTDDATGTGIVAGTLVALSGIVAGLAIGLRREIRR